MEQNDLSALVGFLGLIATPILVALPLALWTVLVQKTDGYVRRHRGE